MLGSNLGQQQALVGRLSDAQLTQELQNPSGVAPAYLLMSEIQKRQSMRDDAAPQTAPKPNIRQQMLTQTQAQQQPAQPGPVMSNGVNSPPSQMPVTQRGPQVPLSAPLNPNLAPFASAPGPHPLPGYAMGGLVQHFDAGGGVSATNGGDLLMGLPQAYAPYVASGQIDPRGAIAAIEMGMGESADPTGQLAAIATARNRVVSGMAPDLYSAVTAAHQYAGYNPRTQKFTPGNPAFDEAALRNLPALAGQADPTGGARYFNSVASVNNIPQSKLNPWQQGPYKDFGGNRFWGVNPQAASMPSYDPVAQAAAQGNSISLPDPTTAAQNAGAIMQQYMNKAPPVQSMDQNIADVQGRVDDPSGAYGNLTKTLQNQIAYQGQMGKWNALMQAGAAMMQAKGTSLLGGLGAGLEAGGNSYQQAQTNQRALQLALANAQVGQAQEHSRYQQGNVQNAMELGKLQSQQQAPWLQEGDTAAKVYGQVQGEDIGAQTARQQHADQVVMLGQRMDQSQHNSDQRSLAGLNDALIKAQNSPFAKTPQGQAIITSLQQTIAATNQGAGVPQGAQTGAVNGGGGTPVNSQDPNNPMGVVRGGIPRATN